MTFQLVADFLAGRYFYFRILTGSEREAGGNRFTFVSFSLKGKMNDIRCLLLLPVSSVHTYSSCRRQVSQGNVCTPINYAPLCLNKHHRQITCLNTKPLKFIRTLTNKQHLSNSPRSKGGEVIFCVAK